MSPEKLLYLSKDQPRDFMDRIVDWAFFQSVRRIETLGSERNIPPKGPFVLGFAPHSGWLESVVIDPSYPLGPYGYGPGLGPVI